MYMLSWCRSALTSPCHLNHKRYVVQVCTHGQHMPRLHWPLNQHLLHYQQALCRTALREEAHKVSDERTPRLGKCNGSHQSFYIPVLQLFLITA